MERRAQRLEVSEDPAAHLEQHILADLARSDQEQVARDRLGERREEHDPHDHEQRLEVVVGGDGWDAGVDALLDQEGDREARRVLDQHDPDQDPDRPLVRLEQLAEQGARAADEPALDALVPLVVVVLRDAAPLVADFRPARRSAGAKRGSRRTPGEVMWRPPRATVGSEQLAVGGDRREQLAVLADVGDRAVLEQRDPVGEQHGRRPVGDDDAGRVDEHPAQRLLDQRLGVDVERRQGVVEHEYDGTRQHRTGEREPLPLTAGERHPLLADPGVEAPRQVAGEAGLRDVERLLDLGVARWVRLGSRPRVRFSRALIENSVGSSNAVATSWRRWARSRSRTSTPSIVTAPPVTSNNRGTNAVRLDLPVPVAPTTATVSPGWMSRLTSRSTGSSSAPG